MSPYTIMQSPTTCSQPWFTISIPKSLKERLPRYAS